jgi:exosortase family protein XrtF
MSSSTNLKEFAPALTFLFVFLAVYLAGNVIYGLYVEYYKPGADPVTVSITEQSVLILDAVGQPATSTVEETSPYVLLMRDQRLVLRVFEGCNGINVMVIFLAFVLAFGGRAKRMIPYLVFGLVTIHVANLCRILLLYHTALYRPILFYYFHKYFFTAVLYLVVFALWILWMRLKIKDRAAARA